MVYGNDICDADKLRENVDGRLNVSLPLQGRGKHLLPKTDKNEECKAASGFCFYGGDARVSEQVSSCLYILRAVQSFNRRFFTNSPPWLQCTPSSFASTTESSLNYW
jgi:hypothetical protein